MTCKCGRLLTPHPCVNNSAANRGKKCFFCPDCRTFTKVPLELLDSKDFCIECKDFLEPPYVEFRQGLCGYCYQTTVSLRLGATRILETKVIMNPICTVCGIELSASDVILCSSCRVSKWAARQNISEDELFSVSLSKKLTLADSISKDRSASVKEVFVVPEKKKRRFDL